MQNENDTPMPEEPTDVTLFDQVDIDKLAPKDNVVLPLLISLSKVADFEPVVIRKNKIDIGRSDSSDIVIDRPNVSRKHATIFNDNLGKPGAPMCILEDRNSRNGTYVNRNKLKGQHVLQDGDTILIGDCVIGFFLKSEAEIKLEKTLKDALARHGHKSDMRRIASNFKATMDVMIPEETFTPKALKGTVKDINMGGLRFVTAAVAKNFWQQLLKEKRHIQCMITLEDGGALRLSGKIAWVHYDNRVVPETCAMGVEFLEMPDPDKQLLQDLIDNLEGA